MRVALPLALLLAGCGAPEAPATVDVRGVYLRSLYDGQAAVLDHEAVPGRMPAMEMDFRVPDATLFANIPPGAPVRVTVDSLSLTRVLAVERLPDGTALDLYRETDDPADSLRIAR